MWMWARFKAAINYLKDPYLIRRIQEACGVHQVLLDTESDQDVHSQPPNNQNTAADSSGISSKHVEDKEVKLGHRRLSSVDSNSGEQNGAVSMDWLKSKVKARRRLRPSPPPSPVDSCTSSDTELPKPEMIIVESYPLLDVYFRLATELGYEPFYITVMPFMFWNVDSLVARHAVLLWCMSMYVGQACKQLFKLKRPASPPVFRLEDNPNLETEYGFPSTHAIVSTTIPFYYFISCFGRYEFPLWLGLILATMWCVSVCFSRIYLGVHSLVDILGGLSIAVTMFILVVPALDTIDHIIYTTNFYGVYILLLVIFLLYIYPVDPLRWTMDRGDVAAIVGVGMGVSFGFHLHGPYPDDLYPGPFVLSVPSVQVASLSIVRFVVGILLLLPTRFVMKLLCFKLLPAVMPAHGVQETKKRPLVELPYKIITYGAIGFNVVYLCPVMFEICNIGRFEEGTAW